MLVCCQNRKRSGTQRQRTARKDGDNPFCSYQNGYPQMQKWESQARSIFDTQPDFPQSHQAVCLQFGEQWPAECEICNRPCNPHIAEGARQADGRLHTRSRASRRFHMSIGLQLRAGRQGESSPGKFLRSRGRGREASEQNLRRSKPREACLRKSADSACLSEASGRCFQPRMMMFENELQTCQCGSLKHKLSPAKPS